LGSSTRFLGRDGVLLSISGSDQRGRLGRFSDGLSRARNDGWNVDLGRVDSLYDRNGFSNQLGRRFTGRGNDGILVVGKLDVVEFVDVKRFGMDDVVFSDSIVRSGKKILQLLLEQKKKKKQ
jgi:hypothetical protein